MAKAKKITKLLFVDTNIWLDFYRPGRGEVTRKFLEHIRGGQGKHNYNPYS